MIKREAGYLTVVDELRKESPVVLADQPDVVWQVEASLQKQSLEVIKRQKTNSCRVGETHQLVARASVFLTSGVDSTYL